MINMLEMIVLENNLIKCKNYLAYSKITFTFASVNGLLVNEKGIRCKS